MDVMYGREEQAAVTLRNRKIHTYSCGTQTSDLAEDNLPPHAYQECCQPDAAAPQPAGPASFIRPRVNDKVHQDKGEGRAHLMCFCASVRGTRAN